MIGKGLYLTLTIPHSTLGLTDLRSHLAVIPQDPVLFQTSLRQNIDPFGQSSEEELWRVVKESNLEEKVRADTRGLDLVVEADGDNFSVGEKQLICLARALVRRNNILLLDEATASLDLRTDHLIQRTIQTSFSSCTVLTIAHRLNTVMQYDKIMVLDQGQLVECDTPNNLLNSNGIFAEMAISAGL